MSWKVNLLSVAILGLFPQDPALTPAQKRQEATRLQLQEAKDQLEAAHAKVEAAETALNAAARGVVQELVDAARSGDEGALRQVLGKLGGGSAVDYQWAAPFKGAGVDSAKIVRLIREQLQNSALPTRSKLCWLLGQNGSEHAAAALRDVLATEKDADVIGTAITELSKCPESPANLQAVRAFADDERLLKVQVGYYGLGSLGKQPLKLIAQQYLEQRDGAKAPAVAGEVTVEEPSLFCAGFQWRIEGDANRNCTVKVAYRKAGAGEWKEGFPFLRCRSWDSAGTKYTFNVGNLLAGSIFDLEPGTEYEVKLTLADPDGGAAQKTVKVTTRTEPPAHAGVRTLHVVPEGAGTGTGTKEDPFKGLVAAEAAAQPGDVLLLQPGTYVGPFAITKSGEPGKPIVWRGTDRAKVILSGNRKDECVSMSGRDHRQFEDLSFVHANQACIKSYGCQHVVVRRCSFSDFTTSGIIGQGKAQRERGGKIEEGRNSKNWFVVDNTVIGGKSWQKDRGSRTAFGVGLSGSGHVIAWNRIEDMWDCVSLSGSNGTEPGTGSLDICYNDLRQGSDDGIEADYIFHNVRIYRNQLTNTFSSLSSQPTYGGPTYMLFNAMQNTGNKPFKLHVNSTGTIIAHNTCTASREAFYGSSAHDAIFMNNLLLGTGGEQGYWLATQMDPMVMDYTGYNVAASTALIKHNNVRYQTMKEFTEATGQMKHAVRVDWDVFAEDARPAGYHKLDKPNPLQLRPGSAAVDAGLVMPGINDGFNGKAPDLGCYELGKPAPQYGPRR